MNILEIVSGAEINGAVVHCLLLSRELAKRGHHVTLLCREDAKLLQLMRPDDRFHVLHSNMQRWPLQELHRISHIIHEQKIDVLHTHMTRAHNFGICLRYLTHIPCVATAHSHLIQLHWMCANYIIAVSDATKTFHQRYNLVRPQRIETVHGFMDFEYVTNVLATDRCEVRTRWGLEPDHLLIGAIGDIIPRKGQLYLIQSLPPVFAKYPNARCVLVGSPQRSFGEKYEEALRSKAEQLGIADKIIWAGYRKDIPAILSALDIYVLASLNEMFPVAVLEAMAAGLPIVATAVGGVPECLENKQTALLVPSKNPSALTEAFECLLAQPHLRHTLAQQAQRIAKQKFSLQSQTAHIETIFEKIKRKP